MYVVLLLADIHSNPPSNRKTYNILHECIQSVAYCTFFLDMWAPPAKGRGAGLARPSVYIHVMHFLFCFVDKRNPTCAPPTQTPQIALDSPGQGAKNSFCLSEKIAKPTPFPGKKIVVCCAMDELLLCYYAYMIDIDCIRQDVGVRGI